MGYGARVRFPWARLFLWFRWGEIRGKQSRKKLFGKAVASPWLALAPTPQCIPMAVPGSPSTLLMYLLGPAWLLAVECEAQRGVAAGSVGYVQNRVSR